MTTQTEGEKNSSGGSLETVNFLKRKERVTR